MGGGSFPIFNHTDDLWYQSAPTPQAGVDIPVSMRQHFGFDDECCGRCAEEIEKVAVLVQVELRKAGRLMVTMPAQAA